MCRKCRLPFTVFESQFVNCHDVGSLPVIEDADIIFTGLDSSLFPGLSSSIEVHQGFAIAHAEQVFLLTWWQKYLDLSV